MEAARTVFAQAGLDLEHLDAELEAVRDEVVSAHYGDGFFEGLRRVAGTSDVPYLHP